MKKTFKGFTLVECLVAMAILAIASTLMASIAANVSTRNNFNHFNNTSLANQMAFIEKYENTQTAKITNTYSGTTPPSGTNSGTTAYVKITKFNSDGTTLDTASTYSYPVDIYIMYSRDTHNKGSNETGFSQGLAGSNNNWELVDSGRKDSNDDPIMVWKEKAKGSGGRFDDNDERVTDYNDNTNENENNLRYKYILGHN